MANTVYVCGFRSTDLQASEQTKLDQIIDKWKSEGWSRDPFHPIDCRHSDFKNIETFFMEENPRKNNEKIVVYNEINIDNETEKQKIVSAVKELQAALPDVIFEVNDEKEKLL